MTAFEQFFTRDFPRLLDTVQSELGLLTGGRIEEASWDRKAAFLLWQTYGRPGAGVSKADFGDLLG